MNINIKATNLELTEKISDYVDKKLAVSEKFTGEEEVPICGVELARSKHHQNGEVYRAEITLELPHRFFRVSATGESVYSAIDQAQEELLREVRREKRKRIHLLRRGGNKLKQITQSLSARGVQVKDYIERFRRR